jgi:two-component system sensor histidine kinase KdpD
MTQVFNNLIDNAVKYSHYSRFVQIQGFDDGSEIHIEVWDKGLGIPESEYDNIFEGLFRGSIKDNKRYIPGTGLGLKISQEIAKAHGGEIRVKSTPFFDDPHRVRNFDGYDTKFTVTLPKKFAEK